MKSTSNANLQKKTAQTTQTIVIRNSSRRRRCCILRIVTFVGTGIGIAHLDDIAMQWFATAAAMQDHNDLCQKLGDAHIPIIAIILTPIPQNGGSFIRQTLLFLGQTEQVIAQTLALHIGKW